MKYLILLQVLALGRFFGPRAGARSARSRNMLDGAVNYCDECSAEIPAGDLYCDICGEDDGHYEEDDDLEDY